jgi:hypothetical protein
MKIVKEIESFDTFLHFGGHTWDAICFYFDGDPIYDRDNDGFEIAYFWSYGQPNILRNCEGYSMDHK